MKKIIKKTFITSIIIFVISTLIHSTYNMLPCFITSIFFSVDESIFEHMKMIFSSYILFLILNNLFLKNKEESLSIFISSIVNIIIFLIIYLPIYFIYGEYLIVTLILYFISILISIYIKFYIERKIIINKKTNIIGVFLIILTYIIFAIITNLF